MENNYSKFCRKLRIALLAIAFVTVSAYTTYATTVTITVENIKFTPVQVNCHVGDTIRWVWLNGSHTTTSTSVPSGAASWNSPISQNATEFKYLVTTAGTYNYKCIPHGASGMTASFTASSVTGINSIADKQAAVSVSPNPFQRNLTVNFKNYSSNKPVNIQVYDILGKQVVSTKADMSMENFYTLDLEDLNPGMYFLYVTGDTKKDIFRIIKSNQN